MYDAIDWEKLLLFQANEKEEYPQISIPFSLNIPYLHKEFKLDLIIWNLSKETLEITERVVNYVLHNFDKLFETAWTSLYYHLCSTEGNTEVAEHTLTEFYQEQIDFESPYYSIQLEINTEHITDNTARYCFVVSTVCNDKKWMISDDDMRIYMVNNKYCNINTNNDNMQILDDMEYLYENSEEKDTANTVNEKLRSEGYPYAESFYKYSGGLESKQIGKG